MPIINSMSELEVGETLHVDGFGPDNYFVGRFTRHQGATAMTSIDEIHDCIRLTRIDEGFYEVICRTSPADVVIEAIAVRDIILGRKIFEAPRNINIFEQDYPGFSIGCDSVAVADSRASRDWVQRWRR